MRNTLLHSKPRRPIAAMAILLFASILAAVVFGLIAGGFATAVYGSDSNTAKIGDADCNGSLELLDAMNILQQVAGVSPAQANCSVAADTNCSGAVDVLDAVRVLQVVASGQELISCALAWPFLGPITNPFDPPAHNGIDIDACGKDGKPVKAAAGGTVKHAASDPSGYGNYVVLRHIDGSETQYAHLESFLVKAGDTVTQGQPIGGVGHTGYVIGECGGTHLHFELKVNGARVNPLLFLPKL